MRSRPQPSGRTPFLAEKLVRNSPPSLSFKAGLPTTTKTAAAAADPLPGWRPHRLDTGDCPRPRRPPRPPPIHSPAGGHTAWTPATGAPSTTATRLRCPPSSSAHLSRCRRKMGSAGPPPSRRCSTGAATRSSSLILDGQRGREPHGPRRARNEPQDAPGGRALAGLTGRQGIWCRP